MADRLLLELRQQGIRAAEAVVDQPGEPALRLLSLGRRQALPEEAVIPVLRAIVEDGLVARGFRPADNVAQRAFEPLVGDEAVELVDIGPVMLAVMINEGLGGHERAQRIPGEGQIGKSETHRKTISCAGRGTRAGSTVKGPRRSVQVTGLSPGTGSAPDAVRATPE